MEKDRRNRRSATYILRLLPYHRGSIRRANPIPRQDIPREQRPALFHQMATRRTR